MHHMFSQRFVRAWTAGLWLFIPHVLLSTYLLLKTAYAMCFGQPNEDLEAGIPYALLNIPNAVIPIPGITSLIIFAGVFGIVRVFNRKFTSKVAVRVRKAIMLFLVWPAIGITSIGLQAYFGNFSPVDGSCSKFPEWVSSAGRR